MRKIIPTIAFAIGVSTAAGIGPYFIERNQAVVVVESGVFDSFGHDAAGELLPSHYE